MLAPGPYFLAIVCLAAIVVALAYSAWQVRCLILPGWQGSLARLAESVLFVALITVLGLLLGTLGLFSRGGLILGALATAALCALTARRWAHSRPDPRSGGSPSSSDPAPTPPAGKGLPPQPPGTRWAALAIVGVVLAHWGVAVSWSLDAGITNFDSVWYHLPFAAEIAQSGSTLHLVRTDTVFLNWLYPQGSELLHAVGMALTGRDLLSLALNIGWLGLAFLASWCLGRPFGRGHLTVAAAAVLLECHNLVAREPGTAKNDIAAIALLLAAAAVLVNLYRSRSYAPGPRGEASEGRSGLLSGPSLVVAALAVGLAAGVKVTALAPAAGLTLAALVATCSGDRLRAAMWWCGGLLVGAYWYLRNLVVAGNPLPQVREIGPLSLPGPDRLQTGRPDFTVSHYLFDWGVWQDYLVPGLERGFGQLWPLVVLLAAAGGVLAVWRLLRSRDAGQDRSAGVPGQDRILGLLGLAALIGMAAYLFTPLSAAGHEGSPTAFAINLRFVIPSLILGLVLLPLCYRPHEGSAHWWLFAVLVAIALVTNGADEILTGSGRLLGIAMSIALLLPLVLLRRCSTLVIAACGAYLVLLVAIGYPIQHGYFENRYRDFAPELGLSEAYSWASDQEESRIGLAGTTAGFHGFGFYGATLSNEVTYLGEEAPRGGFNAIRKCRRFRQAVNEAELDYLVTSPFLNFFDIESPVASPEERWVGNDPALTPVTSQGGVNVWRVEGRLGGSCGAAEQPHTELPDSPRG